MALSFCVAIGGIRFFLFITPGVVAPTVLGRIDRFYVGAPGFAWLLAFGTTNGDRSQIFWRIWFVCRGAYNAPLRATDKKGAYNAPLRRPTKRAHAMRPYVRPTKRAHTMRPCVRPTKRAHTMRPYDDRQKGRMQCAPTTTDKKGAYNAPLRRPTKRAHAMRSYDDR